MEIDEARGEVLEDRRGHLDLAVDVDVDGPAGHPGEEDGRGQDAQDADRAPDDEPDLGPERDEAQDDGQADEQEPQDDQALHRIDEDVVPFGGRPLGPGVDRRGEDLLDDQAEDDGQDEDAAAKRKRSRLG